MEQLSGYSPSFKRPAEILRMRKRRPGPGWSSTAADSRPLQSRRARSTGGTKRRNPFAHREPEHCLKKNRVVERDEEEVAFSLRGRLPALVSNDVYPKADHQERSQQADHQERSQQADHQERSQQADHQERSQQADHQERSQQADHGDHQERSQQADHQEKSPQADHQKKFPQTDYGDHLEKSTEAADQDQQGRGCDYPTDWSLKTRLVFTSPLSLSWAEQPRAQEEALGVHLHCRARFSRLPLSLSDPCSCPELRAAFQQALVYWQHPSLPWLSLFPRVSADRNFSGHNCPWTVDGTVQQSLRSQWALSLSSLYSLLKSGLCPYFYLCSYQFTVLFRAAGLGGCSSITALMSPTTRGLRQSLMAEGIEFILPLVEELKNSRRERAGEKEDCDGDNGDSSFCWLKEMGVQDQIKTPEGLQLQKEKNPVDHKPESVVLVEGSHTFTLVNFLINSKSIMAAAGSQAGLPPTLLSPVAFRGGSMHMLKSRCVNVKSQVEFSYQNLSSLEITGPVLPSSLHTITKLLQHAQKGDFWAVFSTHTPTAVLNIQPYDSLQQGGAPVIDHSSCGVHPESLQQLLQPSILGKMALTHIKMSRNSLSWRS